MRRAAAGAVSALLLCAGGDAAGVLPGNPDFTCTLHHRARMIDSLGALPAPIRDKVGVMAERGAVFNASDDIQYPEAPGRRFIRAGQAGTTWFVWYQQGGISLYKVIALFEPDRSGGLRAKGEYHGNWNADLCAETDNILDKGQALER